MCGLPVSGVPGHYLRPPPGSQHFEQRLLLRAAFMSKSADIVTVCYQSYLASWSFGCWGGGGGVDGGTQ